MRVLQAVFRLGIGVQVNGEMVQPAAGGAFLRSGDEAGPWTVRAPAWATKMKFTGCSGGGGGGGGMGSSTVNGAGGGGGGCGGYFDVEFPLIVGETLVVTVGEGGAAGAVGGVSPVEGGNGGTGGFTSVEGALHFLQTPQVAGGGGAEWSRLISGVETPGVYVGRGGGAFPPIGGGLGAWASTGVDTAGANGRAYHQRGADTPNTNNTAALSAVLLAPALNPDARIYGAAGGNGALPPNNGGNRLFTGMYQVPSDDEGGAAALFPLGLKNQWRNGNWRGFDLTGGAYGYGHGGGGGRAGRAAAAGPPAVSAQEPTAGQAGAPGIAILTFYGD